MRLLATAAALGAGLVALVVSFGTLSLHVVASAMPTSAISVTSAASVRLLP